MMNQRVLEEIALQRQTQLRETAPGSHVNRRGTDPRQPLDVPRTRPLPLRARAGWTLVNLGFRLLAQPNQSGRPRPASY
jgi:hypothetical protein